MESSRIITWNIEESKKKIKNEIKKDSIIIFFTRIVEDLRKYKRPNFYGRIKELYELIYPYSDFENPKTILQKIKKSDLNSKEGLALNSKDKKFINFFLENIDEECKLSDPEKIKDLEKILDELIKIYLPNSYKIVESYILGKLISFVGGLNKLYKMPSSTIQLIGAEKAMFRHLSKGKPSPKYGLIFYSSKIKNSEEKGKTARRLANKLIIAVRMDYFQNFAQ